MTALHEASTPRQGQDREIIIVVRVCLLKLLTRLDVIVCSAGMFRPPSKQYDGRQAPRVSKKYIRGEATREGYRRSSRTTHKNSTLRKTLRFFNIKHYEDAAEMAGYPEKVYLCIERWVGKRRGSTGVWAILEGDFDLLHTYMFNSEILKGIVDFRLEYRRVNWRDVYLGEYKIEGKAQVDAFVLVPSDDRVTFNAPCCRRASEIYAICIYLDITRSMFSQPQEPRRFRSLVKDMGVMYDGIEVAIIEEGGMRATRRGIHLGRCRYAHELHRMHEASRLHESRLCDDLFAQVMEYVG